MNHKELLDLWEEASDEERAQMKPLGIIGEESHGTKRTGMRIIITFSADRNKLGTLELHDRDMRLFSCPCLGRADNAVAAQHGNPARDWRKPYGDTPLGEFTGAVQRLPGGDHVAHSYGAAEPDGMVSIISLAEPAGANEPKRTGIWIHSGDLNPEYRAWNGLRPTFGCIRVSNENKARLLKLAAGPLDVSIRETA